MRGIVRLSLKGRETYGYKKGVRHFLYSMQSRDRAPAGLGDTRSWFLFYKWGDNGEVFVPQGEPFLPIKEDDFVWFQLDEYVLGGAKVVRIEESMSQGVQEIWFNSDERVECDPPLPVTRIVLKNSYEVGNELAEFWLSEKVKKK